MCKIEMETNKKTLYPCSMTAFPSDSLLDEKIEIEITGLISNHTYTIHSFAKLENGNAFECVAVYTSDNQGNISLHKDLSVGGMFKGVEPMGLFWAMKPSLLNKHPHARLLKQDVTTPLVVTISAYDSKMTSLEEIHESRKCCNLSKYQVASVKVNRWYMSQNTKRITLTIERDGIHGTLFIPDGDGSFPGVISMFGIYPGTVEFKAALLASHGFVTLALAFFGVPGLTTGLEKPWYLDLEYFQNAINLLKHHPQVFGDNGIGVIGLSMSVSISLRMAEYLQGIKCVICINGYTCFTFPGIKYGEISIKPLDIISILLEDSSPEKLVKGRNQFQYLTQKVNMQDVVCAINFHTRKDIAFMFIASLSDNECPSEFYLNHAEKLLKLAKHPNYQLLRYPGAGHTIEPPYGAHIRINASKGKSMRDWGGVTKIHCKAQEDAWVRQIKFLKSNLRLPVSSKL